jgi:hypothetical protein
VFLQFLKIHDSVQIDFSGKHATSVHEDYV